MGNCAKAQNWEIHGVERRGKQCFLFQFIDFRLFFVLLRFLGGGFVVEPH